MIDDNTTTLCATQDTINAWASVQVPDGTPVGLVVVYNRADVAEYQAWLSPFEVESALISHPTVLEAAVVPREEEGLLKPKAFVILAEAGKAADQGELFETLKEHVKNEVGQWKYPRWIEFVEDLPKTATGKIQRFKLRE